MWLLRLILGGIFRMILLRKDRLPLLHSVKCECKVKISSPQPLTCRGSRAPRPRPGAAPPQPRARRRRWPRWRGRGARYSAQSSPGQIVLCMLCTVFFTHSSPCPASRHSWCRRWPLLSGSWSRPRTACCTPSHSPSPPTRSLRRDRLVRYYGHH